MHKVQCSASDAQTHVSTAVQLFDPCSWLLAGCCIGYDLFGVFDGHGGKQAASFASKHVLPILQEELAGVHVKSDTALPEVLCEYTQLSDNDKLAWRMQDTMVQCLPAALVSTFKKVQDQFHAHTQVCYAPCT